MVSTRNSHEQLLSSNPPVPEQMFRLAAIAMQSANITGSYRYASRNPSRRRHGNIQEAYFCEGLEQLLHGEAPLERRHRLSILVGKRALGDMPLPEWSMRFFDVHWYRKLDGSWNGSRAMYRFDWDKTAVTLADRISIVVPRPIQSDDMYDELQSYSISDDFAAMMSFEQERAQVTYGDCELLIEDAARYYAARNSEARAKRDAA